MAHVQPSLVVIVIDIEIKFDFVYWFSEISKTLGILHKVISGKGES